MSEQTINVSIIPGDLKVQGPQFRSEGLGCVLFSDIVVIDQRGSDRGWSLRGLFPKATKVEATLMQSAPGSADGITINTDLWLGIEKDGTLGPAGSTGGVYHFDIYVILPLDIDPKSYEFPVLEIKGA